MGRKLTQIDAYKLMHNGSLALARAESNGFRLDEDYAEQLRKKISKKVKILEKKVQESEFVKTWKSVYGSALNLGSGDQLGHILYDKMGIKPTKKTDSGKGSTDAEALEELNLPELNELIEIRKLKKTRDTYLKGFIRESVDGFIHPEYYLHTVETFRSSSGNPNFQNIPKRDKVAKKLTRSILFPHKGQHLLEVDFNALEVSIACCYHKDPNMYKYLTQKGTDMHGDVCQQIYFIDKDNFDKNDPVHSVLRASTKNSFIFPQFYGDYYGNNVVGLCNWTGLSKYRAWEKNDGSLLPSGIHLAEHLKNNGINDLEDFTKHISDIENDFWKKRFKVYNKWKLDWIEQYKRKGYMKTLTGFECRGILGKNQIINFPVQGSAFHVLLYSFIKIEKELLKLGLKSKLLGQIHDAIIMSVQPEELSIVCDILQRVMTVEIPREWDWITVPLGVEIEISPVDGSWAEMDVIHRNENGIWG